MLLLFLLALVWLAALAGWGWLCFRPVLGSTQKIDGAQLALMILLGHVPVIALGYLTHLFMPISAVLVLPLILVGGMIFTRHYKAISHSTILTVGVLALLVGFFASRPIYYGDSGYYPIPAINWYSAQGVVRGLANLDPTLGYNNSWWILGAIFSWPLGVGFGSLFVSIPVLVAVGMLILCASIAAVRGQGLKSAWYFIPGFFLWWRQLVGTNTPSPTSDLPANLLTLVAFGILVSALEETRSSDKKHSSFLSGDHVMLFLGIGALAFSAKISAALVLALATIWLLIRLCLGSRSGWRRFAALGVIAALVLFYLIHSFLLSGYPLFPSSFGAFVDVPWKVDSTIPAETVQRAREWAISFGATPQEAQATPSWKIWVERQGAATNLGMAGVILLSLLVAGAYILLKRRAEALSAAWLLLPAGLISLLLAWNLWNAPALRFSSGYAFALLGCFAAFAGPLLPITIGRMGIALWVAATIISMASLGTGRPFSLLEPHPLPVSKFEKKLTHQGEVIYIPEDGYAWYGPRPSTPPFEFNPRLIIIRDQNTSNIIEMRNRE